MRKSKLLQSSKEMLSRSFNPTKCKTSLRLASARFKLLKNKKEVPVKQMRKEIAQLLESGQEQKARMRVEHVIREEKMAAAFDLLEIYCELIIARLPIIESQKDCPIDLKEAIASVIFASLRCGDVPELLDARKQLTAKYGKDFATAAIELRPQSGVGRMLVEKLSATAPDVQTKTKILSAIAEEHNVKWEHEVLEEKDSVPSSNVSSGASYYGKESKPSVEQPHFEATHSQAHPNTNQVYSQSTNILQHDPRISTEAEKVTIAQPSFVGTTYQPEARPQGYNKQGDSSANAPGRHKWNMEFKDATSAAQAAAESAEMASMAAKAAAELSMQNRIPRQESTESHVSDTYISKDEGPQTHSIPKFSREQFPGENVKESSSAHTGSHNEKIDKIDPSDHKTAARFKEDNRGSPEEYNQPASLKSKSSSIDDPVDYGIPVVGHYSQKNPMDEVSRVETSTNQQTFKHEEKTAEDWARKTESHQEEKIENQHSVNSSRSHSSMSDEVNVFANSEDAKYESDAVENPFVDIAERVTHEGEASHQTSSHEEASVFYDKFDSETDDHGFDLGPKYDEHYSGFNLLSSEKYPPERPSLNPYSWNHRSQLAEPVDPAPALFYDRENSPPIFSENLPSPRDNEEVDKFAPVTFDDSDGPSSDIEEDANAGHYKMEDSRSDLSMVNGKESASTLSFEDINRHSVGSPPFGQSGIHRKQPSISSDSDIEDLDSTKTEVKNSEAGSPVRSGLGKHSTGKPTLGHKDLPQELRDNNHDESSSVGEEGLALGKLTGGLRHKGGNTLTFLKKRVDASSSTKKDTENTTDTSTTSAKPYAVEPPKESSMLYKKKNTLDLHAESDSDSSEDDEFLQRPSGRRQGTYTHTDGKTRLNLGALNSTFASDSSDLDDDPPKESLARKSHPQSGISRRTRVTPASSRTSSHSKTQLRSEAYDIDDDLVRNPVPSYNSETRKKYESERNSGNWENSEPPVSEQHHPVKTTSMSKQGSKTGLKPELQDAPTYHGEKFSKSYSPYTQQTVQSFNWNSNELDNPEHHPTSAKIASKPTTSSRLGTSEKQNSGKTTSTAMQKPLKPSQKPEGSISSGSSKSETLNKNSLKITQKSSTVGEPSKAPQKPEASISSEGSKSETSDKISSTKNDNPKQASHVHPKLPDYDTLFQSLRAKRP